MSLASVHVLTNDELVRSTTAFIPGVLHIVGGFKDHEFEEQLKRRPKNDLTGIRVLIWHPFVIEMTDQQLLVWQVAVRNENKRVLAALNEPSKTPRYDTVPHVLCVGIMGFTIASNQDVEFLEWIYTNFSERHRHQISVYELEAAGSLGTIEVVRWAQSHGYAVPPNMMDVAAGSGHLDFVRYLHDIGSKCTKGAMGSAASGGHLEVV